MAFIVLGPHNVPAEPAAFKIDAAALLEQRSRLSCIDFEGKPHPGRMSIITIRLTYCEQAADAKQDFERCPHRTKNLLSRPLVKIRMYIPKRYGQSRIDTCPFCGKQGTFKNQQGIPVCHAHKEKNLENLRCICGGWLDISSGKWGPYFRCMNCGNINFRKGLEMNPQVSE